MIGRCAIAVDPGSTRTQDLDCDRVRGAALSQRSGWDGEQDKQANNRELNPERTSFYLPWFQQSCKAARQDYLVPYRTAFLLYITIRIAVS